MPSVRLIFCSLLIAEKWSSLLCQFMVISRPLSPATKAPDCYALCVRVCVHEKGRKHKSVPCTHACMRNHSHLHMAITCLIPLTYGLRAVSFGEIPFLVLCVCVCVWGVSYHAPFLKPSFHRTLNLSGKYFILVCVGPASSLCTVGSDKIPGKQSRSRSPCIVFPQKWGLEWCTGVEADKCGILNRVKALLLYPFRGRMPSTEAIKWSLIKNDYSPIRSRAIWSAHTVPHCSIQTG